MTEAFFVVSIARKKEPALLLAGTRLVEKGLNPVAWNGREKLVWIVSPRL